MKSFANAAVFGLVPIPPISDALALDDDVDRHIDRRLSQRRGAVAQELEHRDVPWAYTSRIRNA